MQFSSKDAKQAIDLYTLHNARPLYWDSDVPERVRDIGDFIQSFGPELSLPYYGAGGYPYLYYWGDEGNIHSGPLCATCATETLKNDLETLSNPDYIPNITTFHVEHGSSYDGIDGGRVCDDCYETLIEASAFVVYTEDEDFNETFICIGDEVRGKDEKHEWFTESDMLDRFGPKAVGLMHEYHGWSGFTRDKQLRKLAQEQAERERAAQIDAGQLVFA